MLFARREDLEARGIEDLGEALTSEAELAIAIHGLEAKVPRVAVSAGLVRCRSCVENDRARAVPVQPLPAEEHVVAREVLAPPARTDDERHRCGHSGQH